MALAKRIILFLIINFCIVLFVSFLLNIFHIQPFLTAHGVDFSQVTLFCLLWGMGGSAVSLFLSKSFAKISMGVKLLDPSTRDPHSLALVQMVHNLSKKAGLEKSPDIGIYESPEINAFATGATKQRSLVAVSTGLLRRLSTDQVEGVLAHEIAHISNGDMVTMTLLQGVINAFVLFLVRIVFFFTKEKSSFQNGITWILEYSFMLLGTLALAAFSRHREFHADLGGAELASPEKMISALIALKKNDDVHDPKTDQPAFDCLKIATASPFTSLFATHPPIDLRIVNLQKLFSTVGEI